MNGPSHASREATQGTVVVPGPTKPLAKSGSDFLKKNCIEPLNESFRSGLVQEIDPAKNIFVKVLLEEIDIKDKRDWKISSENGTSYATSGLFCLQSQEEKSSKKKIT